MSDPERSDLWVRTPEIPELREGDVQIWRLDLDGPEGRSLLAQAFEALTVEERQRACRMRTGTAPEEFIAGRGSLRRLLSASLSCDPQGIEIINGTHRKPILRPICGIKLPHFNVSHSRGMVLIALSQLGPVGIDVEYIHSSVEMLDVARAAFHPEDVRCIENARTAKERLLAFYGCWTRREAVAKADGRGLTLPASGFSSGTLSETEQVVEIRGENTIGFSDSSFSRYFVRSLSVSPCHLGAIAVARSCNRPMLLDFSCALIKRGQQTSILANLAANAPKRSNGNVITFFAEKTNLSGD